MRFIRSYHGKKHSESFDNNTSPSVSQKRHMTRNSSSAFNNLPIKTNLRILNINCQSILGKKAEFKASLEYIKPDIVCGTESWLNGHCPGKEPKPNAIQNNEIFPDNYRIFRNDRGTLGGGVFIAVNKSITSYEMTDYITECEIEVAKIKLKSQKDLYICCHYMPHRNMSDLNSLSECLKKITGNKPKHIILLGDFNCPDINWKTLKVKSNAPNSDVQQGLIDLSVSVDMCLTQVHDEPTRGDNILDLTLTTNPSLIKSSVNAPGISDHDMVITDCDIKPAYNRQKPRTCYQYNKAD